MTANPRCSFYVRYPEGEGWRYESVVMNTPTSYLVTENPPAIGDLIFLSGKGQDDIQGYFEVVGRSWLHSSWGSVNWPYGKPESQVGPMLDLIVEPSPGLFVDEVVSDDWDEDDRTAAGGSSSVEGEEVHDGV